LLNPYIFREYDIRGIVGKDLTDDTISQLGKGFGTFFNHAAVRHISLGGDVRLSTPRIRQILAEEITGCGIQVTDIGMVPTPVQYFSMYHLPVDGGIMITGSHNPPDYNGFKLTCKREPVYGKDILRIKNIIRTGKFKRGRATLNQQEVVPDYINTIGKSIQISSPLNIILDSGNGAAGPVATPLFKALGQEVVDLFPEPDGNFPNHHPDPTVVENIGTLISRVRSEKADFGVGFDGDGDRIGVVDESGNIVWGDRLMILFSRDILRSQPRSQIIFEVKCSQALPEMIRQYGGQPLMWKTGHSLLKKKMKETGAPLAGEMSGHLFFADRYYGYDDAIYAAARLAELVSKENKTISQLLDGVPKYFSTPELRAETENDQIKFEIAEKAKMYFSQHHEVIDVDGVRILFADGWGLVRASNTQPVIVLRFEAKTQERLEEHKNYVINKLKEFGEIKI
jgi:phosphomannomutase/phosphoglucomutase